MVMVIREVVGMAGEERVTRPVTAGHQSLGGGRWECEALRERLASATDLVVHRGVQPVVHQEQAVRGKLVLSSLRSTHNA